MADLFLRKLSHTDTSIGTSPVLVKTVMCNADSCILVCLAIYKIECFIDVLFLKSFNCPIGKLNNQHELHQSHTEVTDNTGGATEQQYFFSAGEK